MERNDIAPLELTVKAIVLGVVLAAVLAAANAYLGLFAGMTVSASIPAAVVSMGVLRMFRRRGILENNIVQTAGSAGESLAAGAIFTLPALLILGFWDTFDYGWVTLIAGLGGLIGVLFTIPLRRALVVEQPLEFPEGRATAEVLRAGERGGAGARTIGTAALAGGLFKLGAAGLGLFGGVMQTAGRIGGGLFYFGSHLSPALLSVGYIVGLNIAVLVFAGGAANWLVAIPIAAAGQVPPEGLSTLEWSWQLWSQQTRYIGVGGMLAGGLWAIWRMRRSVFSGIVGGIGACRQANSNGRGRARTERDIPIKWVGFGTLLAAAALFGLYQLFVGRMAVTLPMAAAMLVLGFLFSAVAAYMAGVVGSSNNPVSGVTIATVAVSSLLLVLLMGADAADGPAAAIIIGSVVCCAAAIAGDNMQDLKAGYLVGSTPWKQQVMQMVGVVSAALVIAPILMLLHRAYGFAGQPSAGQDALAAPQANLMASVAAGVFDGNLPWVCILVGVGVAAATIAADLVLEARAARFRMPVLAVAIGFYLPLELSVPIFAGGVLSAAVAARRRKRGHPAGEVTSRRGILFASGLITGEALMGILLAVPVVLAGTADVLAVADEPLGPWPGLLLLIVVAAWMARTAARDEG